MAGTIISVQGTVLYIFECWSVTAGVSLTKQLFKHLTSIAYSRWFSQGAYSLLNRVSVLVFGFLNIFFMVRMMPKADIGIWVLFTSVTSLTEMIRHGFIRNPFITHLVSADDGQKAKVITTSLILHTMLSGFLSITLLLSAGPLSRFWDAQGLDVLFQLYALNTLIFIPFHHFEYLQAAQANFKANFYSNVCRLGLPALYIIIVYFVRHDMTLVELTVVQIIATMLGSIVAYTYVSKLAKVFSSIDIKMLKELFHFGKYTFGTSISSMFVKNTDSWMIGRLISTAGVAVYNPALRIANLVEVPTLAIVDMIFPRVPQKLKEKGLHGIRDIYYKSVSLILATMLPMVFVFYIFSETVITLVFGAEYLESAAILRVTIFYCLIIPFNRQFGTLMDGLKSPKINFYLLVLVAVLNVISNYFFLKWFGLIGSAYGTLLAYSVVFVLNQIILYKRFGINTLKVFEGIPDWYKLGWEIFRKRIVKVA
jgi:lipopolysaccharide exporter